MSIIAATTQSKAGPVAEGTPPNTSSASSINTSTPNTGSTSEREGEGGGMSVLLELLMGDIILANFFCISLSSFDWQNVNFANWWVCIIEDVNSENVGI